MMEKETKPIDNRTTWEELKKQGKIVIPKEWNLAEHIWNAVFDPINPDYNIKAIDIKDVKEFIKRLKDIKDNYAHKRINILNRFRNGEINWGKMGFLLIDLDDKEQEEIDKLSGGIK